MYNVATGVARFATCIVTVQAAPVRSAMSVPSGCSTATARPSFDCCTARIAAALETAACGSEQRDQRDGDGQHPPQRRAR